MKNPFGVMDVPDANDEEVMQFAGRTTAEESADDDNAKAWGTADTTGQPDTIEGHWSSRWNGGADPAIPGDAPGKWKQGPKQELPESAFICCSTGIPARAGD